MVSNNNRYPPVGSDGISTDVIVGDTFSTTLFNELEDRIGTTLDAYYRGIRGEGIIRGNQSEFNCKAQTSPNRSVTVEAGDCIINKTKYSKTSNSYVVLPTAHASYGRWDMVVYNAGGDNASYRSGTASAMADIPALQSDDIPLAMVKRSANDNTIADADILDFRMFIKDVALRPSMSEPSRSIGTIYQNTGDRPIIVVVTVRCDFVNGGASTMGGTARAYLESENVTPPTVIIAAVGEYFDWIDTGNPGRHYTFDHVLTGIVPVGDYYNIIKTEAIHGTVTLQEWIEYQL